MTDLCPFLRLLSLSWASFFWYNTFNGKAYKGIKGPIFSMFWNISIFLGSTVPLWENFDLWDCQLAWNILDFCFLECRVVNDSFNANLDFIEHGNQKVSMPVPTLLWQYYKLISFFIFLLFSVTFRLSGEKLTTMSTLVPDVKKKIVLRSWVKVVRQEMVAVTVAKIIKVTWVLCDSIVR